MLYMAFKIRNLYRHPKGNPSSKKYFPIHKIYVFSFLVEKLIKVSYSLQDYSYILHLLGEKSPDIKA